MIKSKVALALTESSNLFGLRAKDMLFDSVDTHVFYRGQNNNICFVDGESSVDNGESAVENPSSEPQASDSQPEEPQSTDESSDKKNTSGMSEKEAQLLKEVMKWKSKAKTVQQGLDENGNENNPILEIVGDMSGEDLKSLIDNKKAQDREEREARGEYDSIVSQMKEQHSSDLSEKDKLISDKEAEITELKAMLTSASDEMEELTVGRQFSDSSFIKERATLPPSIARQLFGSHFDVEQGKIVGYDKPRGIEGRAPLVNGQAETLGFEAAIERLITSHPESKTLLRSTIKPGSNSSTVNEGGDDAPKKASGADKIRKALEANKS